ncbi:MAG TPA: flagellar basal body-associated FliL family protein [Zoogloea sp.]|uniref:flagellar basal body-associated FliL family protein n=1 Tax=Zoogloea sp. TaxID=49181 RepID=UPI002BA6F731|nr:flagellar basal body-associated FliL family protein [Zoogloea sp.]HMV61928.1 flagellar basal body-associated FliL family protein [Rhodocyclaceae bacterium]HMW50666.1 flagellar basal body-associated FliL family protein [Rhodocyclaceae bacterium]HMY49330.1 flagellar basal body-associated FliL family protein [Rhodocyclaceae bacterium]HMZ74740.1 flagellar basal body-associated FliL family protein [Rhodocyclaceae bacterium]HNA66936.1 flagellar basal body-associated FliL family protein [Rhodocycl
MSKAPAKAEAAEGEAPAKGGGKKKLIIIVAVVLILAIAGGAAFFLLGKKKHAEGEEEEEPAHHEPPKVKVDPSKPPVFVQLDQFTVNLAPEEGEHFLQATMVLRVADAKVGDSLKAYMPELKHRILMLLSSKRPSELANAEGREELADEVKDEANDVLGYAPNPKKKAKRRPEDDGPVLAVLFNQFIVQ